MSSLMAIETWLDAKSPSFASLLPGANEAELDALARAIGRELPPALRALLAWRTGLPAATKKPPLVLCDDTTAYALMSPSEIATVTVKTDKELATGKLDGPTYTTKYAWVHGWIPFARAGKALLVVDTVGSFARSAGQIVRVDTDFQRTIVAPSLDAYLASYARSLSAGRVKVGKTGKFSIAWQPDPELPGFPITKRVERDAKAVSSPTQLALLDIVKQRMSGDEVTAAIANGAAIDARTANGRTPLHLAAQLPSPNAARVLIAAGADVNARDLGAETPLFEAARHVRVEIIAMLRAAGADPTIANSAGQTAADVEPRSPDVIAALV